MAGGWRRWVGMDAQTLRERQAARGAISLFFGALIGANLGSLEALALVDYTVLIIVVCGGIVLYMHVAPFATRRLETAANLLVLIGLLYLLLITPYGLRLFEDGARPKPHLFVTICLWIATVLMIELRPVRRSAASS